jgi:hypothetical protein
LQFDVFVEKVGAMYEPGRLENHKEAGSSSAEIFQPQHKGALAKASRACGRKRLGTKVDLIEAQIVSAVNNAIRRWL